MKSAPPWPAKRRRSTLTGSSGYVYSTCSRPSHPTNRIVIQGRSSSRTKDISICKTPATIRGGGSLQARKGATQSGSHGRPRGKYTITKFGAERRDWSYRRRCFMNVGVSKIFNTASVYCRALAVVIATSKRRIAVIITAIITAMGIKSWQFSPQSAPKPIPYGQTSRILQA